MLLFAAFSACRSCAASAECGLRIGLSAVRLHASRTSSLWACDIQEDEVPSSALYASFRSRRVKLASRRESVVHERKLLAALAGGSETAARALRNHWNGEEGEVACKAVEAAATAGHAALLEELMTQYPEWTEPVNRLATLRYREGEIEKSMKLFMRVLSMKP
jgi:hypothetical protein